MKEVTPDVISTSVRAVGKLSIRSGQTPVTEIPIPFTAHSFVPDPSMLRNGWFVQPEVWVHTNTSAASDGTYYDSARPDPFSAPTVGLARWIASPANYDAISGIWNPYYSSLLDYTWRAPSANPPVLEDITYVVGKELITTNVFRFFPGTRMTSAFNSGFDQSQNFGVAMVVILHPPETADEIGEYPVFCIPDPDDPLAPLVTIRVTDVVELYPKNPDTGVTSDYEMPHLKSPISMIPMYLFFIYTPEGITLHTGSSMMNLTSIRVSFATPQVLPMAFLLGADSAAASTGAFQLMDLTIFDPDDFAVVAAMLTTVYGAGS